MGSLALDLYYGRLDRFLAVLVVTEGRRSMEVVVRAMAVVAEVELVSCIGEPLGEEAEGRRASF